MREAAFVKQIREKWIALKKSHHLEFKIALMPWPIISPHQRFGLRLDLFSWKQNLCALQPFGESGASKSIATKRNQKQNRFWKYEFLLFFVHHHKRCFTPFDLCITTFIGLILPHYDDSFVRLILGDGERTKPWAIAEKGDPMAIYKSGGEIGTFWALRSITSASPCSLYAFGVMISIEPVGFSNGLCWDPSWPSS